MCTCGIPRLPQINDKNTGEAKGAMPPPPPAPVDRQVKKGQSNKGKEETEKEKKLSLR